MRERVIVCLCVCVCVCVVFVCVVYFCRMDFVRVAKSLSHTQRFLQSLDAFCQSAYSFKVIIFIGIQGISRCC